MSLVIPPHLNINILGYFFPVLYIWVHKHYYWFGEAFVGGGGAFLFLVINF